MYMNTGYLKESLLDLKDKSKPLVVGSCGTYRLMTKEKLPTWRPKGRLDYQLLYVVSGKTHFYFKGKERIVSAGTWFCISRARNRSMTIFAWINRKSIGSILLEVT